MNKIVFKILIIISIIIIVLGAFSGMSIKNELIDNDSTEEELYVDGTNFTPFVNAFTEIGAGVLNVTIILSSILVVACIWLVYGIIILIVKIVKKCKKNN